MSLFDTAATVMEGQMAYQRGVTLLEAKNISLKFGDKLILRGINAKVEDLVRTGCITGQKVAFLGPSGIGKSQFLRILAGLQQPTTGEVLITDKQIPVRKGLVGMVAQNHLLFRHRTVLSNLMVAAQHNCSRKEAKDKAITMLQRFGIEAIADQYPSQISGGQGQRVAIAQQLLCSEHYLLMDEPFASLDPIATDLTCNLIAEVADQDEQNTIVVVTHDVRAALRVADTLWIIGRERDETGKFIPGATIFEPYDLIERGLAWHKDVELMPQFHEIEREILDRIRRI